MDWNTFDSRKTNHHSNQGLQYTMVGMRLVFEKLTVNPAASVPI